MTTLAEPAPDAGLDRLVHALDGVAEVIEAIDAETVEQVVLVPLAAPNRAARRRRRGH